MVAKAKEANLFDRLCIRRKGLKIGETPPLLRALSFNFVALLTVENLRSN